MSPSAPCVIDFNHVIYAIHYNHLAPPLSPALPEDFVSCVGQFSFTSVKLEVDIDLHSPALHLHVPVIAVIRCSRQTAMTLQGRRLTFTL